MKWIIPITHVVGCVYHWYNLTTLSRSLIASHGRANTVYKAAGNPHLGCKLAGISGKLSANHVQDWNIAWPCQPIRESAVIIKLMVCL